MKTLNQSKPHLEPGESWGEQAKNHCPIEPDVWKHIIKDGVETGFLRRFRWKKLGEIAEELSTALNLLVCDNPACGWETKLTMKNRLGSSCKKCKGPVHWLIDEYFGTAGISGRENEEAGPFDQLFCYPETGGNEGHGVCIGCLRRAEIYPDLKFGNFGEITSQRVSRKKVIVADHWFRIKTFAGMDHAIELTRRVVNLLGI